MRSRRGNPNSFRLAVGALAVAFVCIVIVLMLPGEDPVEDPGPGPGAKPSEEIDPDAASRSVLAFENPVYTACEAAIGIKGTAEDLRRDEGAVVTEEIVDRLKAAIHVLRPLVRYFAEEEPATSAGITEVIEAADAIVRAESLDRGMLREAGRASSSLLQKGLECRPSRLPGSQVVRPKGPVYAVGDGIELRLPVEDPVLVGFHESLVPTAVDLEPRGTLEVNDNASKFASPPDTDGPAYTVMATRNRSTGATTGSDIVVPPGTIVRSPVTGRVSDVDEYILYCEVPDIRVMVEVRGHPDVRVVLLHLDEVKVRPGQRVVAGRTVIGVPRIFYASHPQFAQYTGGDYEHVHIEIDAELDPPLPEC